ncbi:translation elongation factor Ts [Chondrinema litorale]|uniref:translation elongation factor Ts n=1 Tax=Chondrinema litorale TaxID=2994555 RepID=UPI0025441577|nr:translation elongation factor Ts [Chondrinema litorale]UZR95522.1 translation elongation factor Ts [Chondrinema litorale]
MAITAKQVNELRQITGAGMMDCKNALVEAEGDIEKAIDLLRKKGQKVAAKRADREASEGNVYSYINEAGTVGIAFALNCETEPVSNTEEFKKLGETILKVAIDNAISSKEEVVEVEVDGKKIAEYMVELSGKIGEKIEISDYAYIEGEQVVDYLHGTSIVVLVNLAGGTGEEVIEAGKNVAMQIAAMKPLAVDKDGIDIEVVEREKQVGIEKAREEGKPEHILDKIAQGFVQKFFKENTLLSQQYVKEPKQSVTQYLDSVKKGLTVKSFSRIGIGR